MKLNIKKLAIKLLITALALLLFVAGYYVVYLYCGYQRIPDERWISAEEKNEELLPVNEELTLVTYNIGFGAYSDDFSFFMDGGEHSRALSKQAVEANMAGIIDTLTQAEPDLLLLQEVDIKGTRSYGVDQNAMLIEEFDEYESITAVNYDSPYYLYPLREPIGKNKSCIMTLSRFSISNARRMSLPVEKSLYKYLDLDRAYTVTRILTSSGRPLSVFNLHLSAYTSDGRIADEQLEVLFADMLAEYEDGCYVIAAGDFNKDLLGDSSKYFERKEQELLWARPFDTWLLPKTMTLHAATNQPSCRNADSPYKGDGTDFVLTIDGMITSKDVKVVSSETIDTGFKYSDHNPVKYTIRLEASDSQE